MKTRTALALGTLACVTYSGVLGYCGQAWPGVPLEDYFWGDFAVFFAVLMMRKGKHGIRQEIRKGHHGKGKHPRR